MDLSPWDYWQAPGRTPKGRLAELSPRSKAFIAANPEHPGAIHHDIHLVEASAEPARAVPCADRLASLIRGPVISSICRPISTTGSAATWIR